MPTRKYIKTTLSVIIKKCAICINERKPYFQAFLIHQLQLNKLVFLLGFDVNEGNDNHQYKTNIFFEKKVEKIHALLSLVMVITIVRA
jgi:hypothetical protein